MLDRHGAQPVVTVYGGTMTLIGAVWVLGLAHL
jgi:hypothetical protein